MILPSPPLHRLVTTVPSRPLHCDAVFEGPVANAAVEQRECILLSQHSYGNIAVSDFVFVSRRYRAHVGLIAFDDEIEGIGMDGFHIFTFADDVRLIRSRSRLKVISALETRMADQFVPSKPIVN